MHTVSLLIAVEVLRVQVKVWEFIWMAISMETIIIDRMWYINLELWTLAKTDNINKKKEFNFIEPLEFKMQHLLWIDQKQK